MSEYGFISVCIWHNKDSFWIWHNQMKSEIHMIEPGHHNIISISQYRVRIKNCDYAT